LELWRLLAHNHWFTLNLYGYRVRLCARCSGYILGFATMLLILSPLSDLLGLKAHVNQGYVFFLLAIPLVLDWVTQSWGLRTSNNYVRLITGGLMGVNIFLFSNFSTNFQMGRFIFFSAALAVVLIGLLGKVKRGTRMWNVK